MENFIIFSNKEKKNDAIAKAKSQEEQERISKWPDFKISVKNGDDFEDWGVCWWKQGKDGQWFQSCSKNRPKPESAPHPGDGIPF